MKIALLILGILIIVAVIIVAISGGFAPVKTEIKTAGGELMVFENMQGSYSQTPKIMNKMYDELVANGIAVTQGIGYYYDNPQSVAESQLRSEIGNVIRTEDLTTLQSSNLNYQTRTLPEQEYLIIELPYPNQLSVPLQMMKAYPALSKYSQENGLVVDTPVTEIYDVANQKIIYRKEIVRE